MPPQRNHNLFFFFNDTATTEIYTLSLHDALPISRRSKTKGEGHMKRFHVHVSVRDLPERSEEHTSELQSLTNLVCRLLLEKKKHFGEDMELFSCLIISPVSVKRLSEEQTRHSSDK